MQNAEIIKFRNFAPLCLPAMLCIALQAGLLPLCLLLSAETKPPHPSPVVVCDESEYFFSSVPNTEIIKYDFILSNEGTVPLYISAVRTDCGCVLTRLSNDTLAPGESVALKVKFDLKRRSGQQIRRIIVESNDPDQPRLVLALIGEALAPIEIIPDQICWGNIHVSTPVEKSCEIRFGEGDESYINSVILPDPTFAAELISVKPRRIYKAVIRTVPPLNIGSFQSVLKVTTDHPRFQTIEIPMQGRFVGDIYAIPEEIIVKSPSGQPVSRTLLVYSGLKKKFKLLRVDLPRPDIEAHIRPMAMANGYRIDLRNITPSKELDGTNIVIVTDCENAPTCTVPLRVPTD